MQEEAFVTETPGLHTTIVKGIHEIVREGDLVRIFTYDRRRHPGGIEHHVNGDFLMTVGDLENMLLQVYEFALTEPQASVHRELLESLRERRH